MHPGRSASAPSAPTRSFAVRRRSSLVFAPLVLVGFLLAGLGLLADVAPAQPNTAQKVTALSADVAALDARISEQVNRYGDATAALSQVRSAVRDNRRALEVARFNLATTKIALANRVVALYKQQTPGMVDVLMQAGNLNDAVTQADAVQRLAANDRRLVDDLTTYSRDIESRSVKLAADEQSLTRLVGTIQENMTQIRDSLAQRKRLLAGAQSNLLASLTNAREPQPSATVTPPATPGGSGVWWVQIKSTASANGISADGLYRLMMAESGGSATANNSDRYLGLFQYTRSCWSGSWNPYRKADIFDGSAQIKATALAIKLGHGPGWWPSYSWAFQTQ